MNNKMLFLRDIPILVELKKEICDCEFIRTSVSDKRDLCGVWTPSVQMVCTRKKGHIGKHKACSITEHNLETW
jgi:hypothetical protein